MDSNTGGHSLVASLIPVAEQSVKDSLLDVCSDLSNCKSQLGRGRANPKSLLTYNINLGRSVTALFTSCQMSWLT
jgi:hypothetical protein